MGDKSNKNIGDIFMDIGKIFTGFLVVAFFAVIIFLAFPAKKPDPESEVEEQFRPWRSSRGYNYSRGRYFPYNYGYSYGGYLRPYYRRRFYYPYYSYFPYAYGW